MNATDPDATLATIRDAVGAALGGEQYDREGLAEAFLDLDRLLTDGGRLPRAWATRQRVGANPEAVWQADQLRSYGYTVDAVEGGEIVVRLGLAQAIFIQANAATLASQQRNLS